MRCMTKRGDGDGYTKGAEFLDLFRELPQEILCEFSNGLRIDLVAELLESLGITDGVHGD